jgi:osmoprotectant transport system permease protein
VKWSWIGDHTDLIVSQGWEHVALTVLAIGIGLLISLPIAIYAYRHKRVYGPIAGIAGLLYTIPSLALFAALQSFTGLSYTTAEIGLVSYTLLILIRNTVAGLQGVPPEVKEAARGMGYSNRQMLLRIELPLAVPVIIAGLRLATVTVIGLVTVTALIGLGGFGYFILLGFRTFEPDLAKTIMLLGAVLSLVLAVFADAALVGLERVITPWTRAKAERVTAT